MNLTFFSFLILIFAMDASSTFTNLSLNDSSLLFPNGFAATLDAPCDQFGPSFPVTAAAIEQLRSALVLSQTSAGSLGVDVDRARGRQIESSLKVMLADVNAAEAVLTATKKAISDQFGFFN